MDEEKYEGVDVDTMSVQLLADKALRMISATSPAKEKTANGGNTGPAVDGRLKLGKEEPLSSPRVVPVAKDSLPAMLPTFPQTTKLPSITDLIQLAEAAEKQ